MPYAAPGTPQVMGGNDPARSAAMSRLRGSQVAAGPTTPNQLPQGSPQGPQAGVAGGPSPVAQLLAQAFDLFVQRGAVPEDQEAIKGFLVSIQQLAESAAPQAPQGQAGPGVGAGPLPVMSAQGSPQPSR